MDVETELVVLESTVALPILSTVVLFAQFLIGRNNFCNASILKKTDGQISKTDLTRTFYSLLLVVNFLAVEV